MLGPCCPEKQFAGLPPSTEAGAVKRTVLASKEATPPQGVRGEGRQKAWLLGVISRPVSNPAALVPGRWRSPPAHQTGRTREGRRRPSRGNEVARSRCRTGGANHPCGARRSFTGARSRVLPGGKRGPRREPRAEEDSRLAGVPARRTCVAEIGRQSQAQRSPCETPSSWI
jgi:hypothetical protein